MNDKELEEFEKWWDDFPMGHKIQHNPYAQTKEAFQAACEYKQKDIDELETFIRADAISVNWENKEYQEAVHYSWLDEQSQRLQAENAKLRECVEFYANTKGWDNGKKSGEASYARARETLAAINKVE